MPRVSGKLKRTIDTQKVADVGDVQGALSQDQVDERAQLKVDALEDNAPTALDTLNELAAALGDDASYAASITTALGTKAKKDLTNVADDSVSPAMLKADSVSQKTAMRERTDAHKASSVTSGRFHVDRVGWKGTQADFDSLTPDANTIYLIIG